MNIDQSQNRSPQNISNISFNQAMNNELTICYERISNMVAEIEHYKNINHNHIQQIKKLNGIIDSKLGNSTIIVSKCLSEGFTQTDDETRIQDLEINSYYYKSETNKEETFDLEIESLINQKLQLQIELEVSRIENSVLTQRHAAEIQNIRRNTITIANQKQNVINQLFLIKNQRTRLFEEIDRKSVHIDHHDNKIRHLQAQLQNARSQTIRIRYNDHSVQKRNQETKLKDNSTKIINQLQQKIGLLQSQNRHLKQTIRQNQRKVHTSIQIKQQVLVDNQFKLLKQDYAKTIKQNIMYVEINAKHEKNYQMMNKELEILKRQKSERTNRLNDLITDLDVCNIQLQRKQQKIEELTNALSNKQSEYSQMRRSMSIELIEKIGVNNRTSRQMFMTKKKDMSEVPVRDSSVLQRSRTSSKTPLLKQSIVHKKI